MEQHITLYYRQGSSDKIYQASLAPKDDGFVVQFQYGRRGSALQSGQKNTDPVPFEEAKSIFDKLVREKMAKGYSPGEDGTPYALTDHASRATGIQCQLLNPVAEGELASLLGDEHWWAQEKHDGERRLIQKAGEQVLGINRRGLEVALPQTWVEDSLRCPSDFLLDGEAVGDFLHVFDLLRLGDQDLTSHAYLERHLRLMHLLSIWGSQHVRLVRTCCLQPEKAALLQDLKARGAEGIVLKRIDQPYHAGRPASGGPALKFKFVESATFLAGKSNSKRSVELLLLNGGSTVSAGNVTIPPNHEIPEPGQAVEVRYLYTFPDSGAVYQPVYGGPRTDVTPEECSTAQLKFRPSVPASA